jgi:hypothetical protein
MWQKIMAALCLVALSGCVTRGKDFVSDLSWIKINETSQAQVASNLGEPTTVGNSSGAETWTYGFYHYKLFGESYTKELKFYWSPDKKVRDYSFNSSFPQDRRGRAVGTGAP